MTTYTPPAGNEVALPLFGEYDPPLGNLVALPFGPDAEPPPQFVSATLLRSAMPWRDTDPRRLAMRLAFGTAVPITKRKRLGFDQTKPAQIQQALAWARAVPRPQPRAVSWTVSLPRSQAVTVSWRDLDPSAQQTAIVWRDTEQLSAGVNARWLVTTPTPIEASAPWRDTVPANKNWSLPFLFITDKRRPYDIPWQGTRPPPTIWKPPPVFEPPGQPGQPDPPPPVYVPPAGNNVALPFNCDLIPTPGNRVALPFRRFQCLRRSFVVDNDITIKRVDTDEIVAATSVSVGGNIDSFSYSFSASVPRAAGLDIVNPTDGPVEIEININGQVFLCLVESWSDDRTWRGARRDEIVLQGRAIVAELDEPYFPARNYPRGSGDTETFSAVQRMIEEIPLGSGWEIETHPDWVDYPIPPGSLTYSGLTPIRAIALIAQSSGAVVLPVPSERKLLIVPRFVARPWRIGDAEATVEIDYGVVEADRAQWLANRDSTPRLGIYVEGDVNGRSVLARIDDTSGEWAEPVFDPLITDAQAGVQRGVTELGMTWVAAEIGLQIPMGTQAEGEPGWIAPGQVVSVLESAESSWQGISTGWQIAGQWSDSDGLTVSQRVTIERYLELT